VTENRQKCGMREFGLFVLLLSATALAQPCKYNYDNFLSQNWTVTEEVQNVAVNLSGAVLVVIDMQKDFTFGSFGLPCFGTSPVLDTFIHKLAAFIRWFGSKGGYVVASKDWHPADHCSFGGESDCQNVAPPGSLQWYQNRFPVHCTFSNITGAPEQSTAKGADFRGGDFHPLIAAELEPLIRRGQGSVVFKGFTRSFESFGAFSMEGAVQAMQTGGWALRRGLDPQTDLDDFFPELEEMADHQNKMISLADLLKQKQIQSVLVSGLVFDYCCADTAKFALTQTNLGPGATSLLLPDLSRPSVDGSGAKVPSSPAPDAMLLGSSERILQATGEMLRDHVRFVDSSEFQRLADAGSPQKELQ